MHMHVIFAIAETGQHWLQHAGAMHGALQHHSPPQRGSVSREFADEYSSHTQWQMCTFTLWAQHIQSHDIPISIEFGRHKHGCGMMLYIVCVVYVTRNSNRLCQVV